MCYLLIVDYCLISLSEFMTSGYPTAADRSFLPLLLHVTYNKYTRNNNS